MKRIIIIFAAFLLAVCCGKDEKQPGLFEVNGIRDSYAFAPDLGQKFAFDIVSDNVLWEITFSPADQDWLTVSPLRSLGGYETVTLSPDYNASKDSRSCSFTITSENGYSKTVSVSQRGL